MVYLDHHATTPLDPRVLAAMMPYLTGKFGNAASRNHKFGWEAEQAVDESRKQIARLIGASPREIIFTSGATESDNLAIKGVAEAYAGQGDHVITCAIEHKAVLDVCRKLEQRGARVTRLPVGRDGLVDPGAMEAAIGERTVLVSIMYANNEVGAIQPVAEIGRICRERGVPFHSDAAQAVGKVPVNVDADSIDLLSISAHKMYGPKGAGALYVRRRDPRVQLTAQMDGGGHEGGRSEEHTSALPIYRPALDFGAQDVRAQGRRRALRASARSTRAVDGPDGWRRSRGRQIGRAHVCSSDLSPCSRFRRTRCTGPRAPARSTCVGAIHACS